MARMDKTQVIGWTLAQFRRPLTALFGLICFVLTPLPLNAQSGTPDAPGPAMWRIADDDTEIFLFGTIHVLPPGINWQRVEVENVLETADVVFFETSERDLGSDAYLTFFQAGMAGPGEGIHDVLSEDQFELLSGALSEFGLNIDSFKGQQPWFTALMLSSIAMEMQGHLADYGVETWIEARLAFNRDVRSLESGADVANALSDLPVDVQISMLLDGLEDTDTAETTSALTQDATYVVEASIKAWLKGDTDLLYQLVVEEMESEMPELYDVMFTERNLNWTNKLDALMIAETGRFFVAVGSGHLVGPDSVVAMMESRGWDAERF